jgi:hypothetical protein
VALDGEMETKMESQESIELLQLGNRCFLSSKLFPKVNPIATLHCAGVGYMLVSNFILQSDFVLFIAAVGWFI